MLTEKITAMTMKITPIDIYQNFSDFLKRFLPLSSEIEQRILSIAEPIRVKKGKHLLREGEVNEYFYFMQSGAAYIYFDKGNKRVATWLSMDTDMLTTINTIRGPQPAKENLEMLEDGVLLRIHYDDMQRLYDESKEFERLGRLMISYYFGVMNNKLHQSYFLTAKERYENLIERYPEVNYRIPLGIVASYLGISQETLSRIRNPKYGRK
ncbi:hypothetical protein CEQ90_17930 [Lewinellaceae bacterium SD302]|nr:hypothetical protein CEQ90_17930 [Lewinellaceae bacterium SD302]